MRCKKCYTSLSDSAKFCSNCGVPIPLTTVCSNCGSTNTTGSKYCKNCGAPHDDLLADNSHVDEGFPWGKVSYNPFKWNPLGLTRRGTIIYVTILFAGFVLLRVIFHQ